MAEQTTLFPVGAHSEALIDATSRKTMPFGASEPGPQMTPEPQDGADARTAAAGTPRVGRPYRGLTANERRAARRQRLLDVGLSSFGTAGFAGTSIGQLCSDAGVTPRHFYEEFPSREALLSAVYDEAIRVTHEATQAAVAAAPPDPGIRTKAAINAFVHAMCDDPCRARVLCMEGVRVNGEFERHRREVIHSFADVTGASFRDSPLHVRPLVLLGVVHELVIEWLLSDSRPPLEELIDELAEIWLAASQPA